MPSSTGLFGDLEADRAPGPAIERAGRRRGGSGFRPVLGGRACAPSCSRCAAGHRAPRPRRAPRSRPTLFSAEPCGNDDQRVDPEPGCPRTRTAWAWFATGHRDHPGPAGGLVERGQRVDRAADLERRRSAGRHSALIHSGRSGSAHGHGSSGGAPWRSRRSRSAASSTASKVTSGGPVTCRVSIPAVGLPRHCAVLFLMVLVSPRWPLCRKPEIDHMQRRGQSSSDDGSAQVRALATRPITRSGHLFRHLPEHPSFRARDSLASGR